MKQNNNNKTKNIKETTNKKEKNISVKKKKNTTIKKDLKIKNIDKQTNSKKLVIEEKNEIKKEVIKEEQKSSKKHNGIISFWKFIYCVMIVIFHGKIFAKDGVYTFFSNGGLGVEFFFLVSGYLLAKSALNKKEEPDENLGFETIKFVWKKFKVFFPYMLVFGIMSICLNGFLSKSIFTIISTIWDFLFLRMSGIKTTVINGSIWYISSMLICMIAIYPLLRKYKYNFVYIAVPLIVLLGFGFLSKQYKDLRTPDLWIGLTYKSNIRAFAELCLGSLIYVFSNKIKTIEFTKFGKFTLTIIELLGFIFALVVASSMKNMGKYDFLIVFILSISIAVAFSEKTLEVDFLSNKFCYWLEKFSLPVYMSHIPIRNFLANNKHFSSIDYPERLCILLLATIIVSLVTMYTLEFLKKRNYYFDKIKKLFVIEKNNNIKTSTN